MKWRLIVAEFYKYNSNFTKIIYAKLKKIKPTLYIYIYNHSCTLEYKYIARQKYNKNTEIVPRLNPPKFQPIQLGPIRGSSISSPEFFAR